jgi:invasion protein IalB
VVVIISADAAVAKVAVMPPLPFTVRVALGDCELESDNDPEVSHDWKTCCESGVAVSETCPPDTKFSVVD